jgi:hypothetical protein
MGEVLEDPTLNTEKLLVSRVTELVKLDTNVLKEMAEKGKVGIEGEQIKKKKEIKKKFKV